MEYPSAALDQIRELHRSAAQEAKRLREQAEVAEQTERIWADLVQFIERGWTLHILDLLDRETPRLKKMREEPKLIVSSIEDLYRVVREESTQIFRRYPALLEDAFRSAGMILDRSSRHPKYVLERGFFWIEIDEAKRIARVYDYEGKLDEHPADVEAVVKILQREHQRVFGRDFDGQKFLQSLRQQYKAILQREKLKDGSSVPIRQITKRMGKNLKGFRTDEFNVDLARLAEKGPFEIDGRRLDLQQTKDTNQGMLLYGAAERGYIGFVTFREV